MAGGQLALSLLPDPTDRTRNPYQGLIELAPQSLAANLDNYFANSEQVPTRFCLAASAGSAAGLLLQRLPDTSVAPAVAGSAIDSIESARADACWRDLQPALAALTTQDMLSAVAADTHEALLQSLCNAAGPGFELRLAPPKPLAFGCTCHRQKSASVLRTLGAQELQTLFEEQTQVEVTCEFCGKAYAFDRADRDGLLALN